MAITLEELKSLLTEEGLQFFVDPNRPAVMVPFGGASGRLQFMIVVELDGQFIQFRTFGYLHCPADHAHLGEVLKLIGAINFSLRLVKFGWDPSDGEIVGFADMWLMDAGLTQEQLSRMLGNYVPSIDATLHRLKTTMETGQDPGPQESRAAVADAEDEDSSLPPELREHLARIAADESSDDDHDEDDDDDAPEITEI